MVTDLHSLASFFPPLARSTNKYWRLFSRRGQISARPENSPCALALMGLCCRYTSLTESNAKSQQKQKNITHWYGSYLIRKYLTNTTTLGQTTVRHASDSAWRLNVLRRPIFALSCNTTLQLRVGPRKHWICRSLALCSITRAGVHVLDSTHFNST